MTSAIVMRELSKDYGSGHGLFDLDLDVAEGEIFGFLGPNGAGKTTTIILALAPAQGLTVDVGRMLIATALRVPFALTFAALRTTCQCSSCMARP